MNGGDAHLFPAGAIGASARQSCARDGMYFARQVVTFPPGPREESRSRRGGADMSHATLIVLIAAAALGPAILDVLALVKCALVPSRCRH